MDTLIAELQLAPMIGTVIYSVLGILILDLTRQFMQGIIGLIQHQLDQLFQSV